MSVLVKGMEKPEHCGYCRFRYDGICHALQKTQYSMDECPLVGIDDVVLNDTISRQAAIDVIDAVFPVDPMKSEYAQGIACGAALAKTYVKQLPSVPVIRCKDCKWFGDIGCAISIVDGTDKPSEEDYCSFAERRTDANNNLHV